MALQQPAKQACTARPSFTPVVVPRSVCFRPVSSCQRPVGRKTIQVVAVAATDIPVPLDTTANAPPPPPPELPRGFHWYETMIILNPLMKDEDRDKELAKFEAYMAKEGVTNVQGIVRARTQMAYSMKGQWEGMYVLYNYAAKRATAKAIQLLLSTPEAGSENNVIRHITVCKS